MPEPCARCVAYRAAAEAAAYRIAVRTAAEAAAYRAANIAAAEAAYDAYEAAIDIAEERAAVFAAAAEAVGPHTCSESECPHDAWTEYMQWRTSQSGVVFGGCPWCALAASEARVKELETKLRQRNASLDEALNSGDGVYHP